MASGGTGKGGTSSLPSPAYSVLTKTLAIMTYSYSNRISVDFRQDCSAAYAQKYTINPTFDKNPVKTISASVLTMVLFVVIL